MKTTFKTLVIALVALFSFGTASAQSLSSYKATFSDGTLTVTDIKAGGFGAKTRAMKVEIFLEVESSVDCSNYTKGQGTTFKTFTNDEDGSNSIEFGMTGKGFAEAVGPFVVSSEAGSRDCPGGWTFVSGGNAEVTRAYIVITGIDDKGNIKTSGQIDITYSPL